MSTELSLYRGLLSDIKVRFRQAQHKAALSANAEMILMYWDIGRLVAARQEQEGWGAGIIPRLEADLRNELPEEKGFSARNIGRMIAFYRAYPFLPQAAAKFGPQLPALLKSSENEGHAIGPDHEKTKIGYEILFNRNFYVFTLPRPLAEIDAELKGVTDRILAMIGGLSK